MKNISITLLLIITIAAIGCGGHEDKGAKPATPANIAGTWAGTFTSDSTVGAKTVPPANGTTTVNFTENGTTVSGSGVVKATCFTTFNVISGTVLGETVSLVLQGNDGGKTSVFANASPGSTDGSVPVTSLAGTYQMTSGACARDTGVISLTKK